MRSPIGVLVTKLAKEFILWLISLNWHFARSGKVHSKSVLVHSVKAKLTQTMKGGGRHGLTCKDRRSYNVQSVKQHSGYRFTWSKQLRIKLEVCWFEDELSKKMRCKWDVFPWSWVNVISCLFKTGEIRVSNIFGTLTGGDKMFPGFRPFLTQ